MEINEIELNFNCNSDISIISTDNAKHSHCNQHHYDSSTTMQQHVLHAEMSEHDKAYFTEDIESQGKSFQKLVSKAVLISSQINKSKEKISII